MAWRKIIDSNGDGITDIIRSGKITHNFLFYEGMGHTSDGTQDGSFEFNGDNTTNYAVRRSLDGASDASEVSQKGEDITTLNTNADGAWYISGCNIAHQEKLVLTHSVFWGASGTGSSPTRLEAVVKWDNVVDKIKEFWWTQDTTDLAFTSATNMSFLGSD